MSRYLTRKLELFTRLSSDDKSALERVSKLKLRHLSPREDIFAEGEKPGQVSLILEGWACRYRTLEDGRRQITAFLLPGDMSDLRMFILKSMDHSVAALTKVLLAEIPPDTIVALSDSSPRLARALWWSSLVEEAIQREWTTSLGQREAFERLAHLFCELFIRLMGVGLTEGDSCDLPVTQEQLGDATGMTTVHVNRTLTAMRDAKLIVLRGRKLIIPDLKALKGAALFNDNYLHLDRVGRALDANEG